MIKIKSTVQAEKYFCKRRKPHDHIAQGIALRLQTFDTIRPAKAKALVYNAFALAGRMVNIIIITQDDALSYELLPRWGV